MPVTIKRDRVQWEVRRHLRENDSFNMEPLLSGGHGCNTEVYD